MTDRRTHDRRQNLGVPEPLERQRPRRAGERRESVRYPVAMQVQPQAYTVAGELGLGGASYAANSPPLDDVMSLRVLLGGEMFRLPAKLLRLERTADGYVVHVTFEELPVATELAMARWLDDRSEALGQSAATSAPARG